MPTESVDSWLASVVEWLRPLGFRHPWLSYHLSVLLSLLTMQEQSEIAFVDFAAYVYSGYGNLRGGDTVNLSSFLLLPEPLFQDILFRLFSYFKVWLYVCTVYHFSYRYRGDCYWQSTPAELVAKCELWQLLLRHFEKGSAEMPCVPLHTRML